MSASLAAAALAHMGPKERMVPFLVRKAQLAKNDAHTLWPLDALKYLDTPTSVEGYAAAELVKGQYSERAFDFLLKGGRVGGDGIDYWNS